MSNTLILGTSAIREQDSLYSLNDLHAASGGEKRHEPNRFMRIEQTQALIAALTNYPEMGSLVTKTTEGRSGGTYACRELVIAYAAWISAAFHLKVIRVFLDKLDESPVTLGRLKERELLRKQHLTLAQLITAKSKTAQPNDRVLLGKVIAQAAEAIGLAYQPELPL